MLDKRLKIWYTGSEVRKVLRCAGLSAQKGVRMAKKSNKSPIGRGRGLTQLQREMIIQAYALCGNKSQVARDVGCSAQTVTSVVKAAETDRSLQKARSSALEDVAGKLHAKTTEIIESIVPEDMESGLIKVFDKEDPTKLKSVKAYGPSLLQKVTSAAILVDKTGVVETTKQALIADNAIDPHKLPLPGEMQESLRLLGKKIKHLRVVDIQFADKHEETVSKVQETAHAASLNEHIEEADYEDLDFDNPS